MKNALVVLTGVMAGVVLILLLVTVRVMSKADRMPMQMDGMAAWGVVWLFLILAIVMALIMVFIRGAGRR